MSIKYYRLAKDEEPPEEFCAVRDMDGEPSEYMFYVPEAENVKLREQIHWLKQGDILHVLTDQEYIDQCERERLMQVSIDALDKDNAKLRECLQDLAEHIREDDGFGLDYGWMLDRMRELGVEVHDA